MISTVGVLMIVWYASFEWWCAHNPAVPPELITNFRKIFHTALGLVIFSDLFNTIFGRLQNKPLMDAAQPSSSTFFSRETISDVNGVVTRVFTSVKDVVSDNVGPKTKAVVALWIVCSVTSFCTAVYGDGRRALSAYRSAHEKLDYSAEWETVSNACKSNTHKHFWDATILPYTIVSNVLPFVILRLNPPPAGKIYKGE